jgi:hypothetical protein
MEAEPLEVVRVRWLTSRVPVNVEKVVPDAVGAKEAGTLSLAAGLIWAESVWVVVALVCAKPTIGTNNTAQKPQNWDGELILY